MSHTVDSTIVEIRVLTDIISRLAKRDLEKNQTQSKSLLSVLQLSVLRLVSCREYTIAELGRFMVYDPATLVQAVDMLEREGLLKRGQDSKDRRRTPLALTAAGHELVSTIPVLNRDDAVVRGLTAMGDAKAEQLLALLRELALAMAENKNAILELPNNMRQILQNTQIVTI